MFPSLLLLFLLLFVAPVQSRSCTLFIDKSENDEQNREFIAASSKEASILLEAAGIVGLCHPTTLEFEPYFPLCASSSSAHLRRSLSDAQQEQQQQSSRPSLEDEPFFIQNGLLALLCVCTAALAAGLTMGLLSLDPLLLLIKMRAGSTQKEKDQAASLLPIVKQHHLLLVTLLLLNSIANEALPLFLDNMFPGYVAVLISVFGVLFFGEIIPSAVFTGPDKIIIAANMVPLVRVVMAILYPLAYPIAKLLDHVLHDDDGDEVSSMYNRGELSALVRIQYEERLASKKKRKMALRRKVPVKGVLHLEGGSTAPLVDYNLKDNVRTLKKEISKLSFESASPKPSASTKKQPIVKERSVSIHFDEVSMVEGALTMGTKVAKNVCTPLRKLFAIPYDSILDENTVVSIYSSGFSRIPVFDRNPKNEHDFRAIRGILMTKQLIVVSSYDRRPLKTLPLLKPFCIATTENLVDCINLFQTGAKTAGKGGHLALVCARPDLASDALDRDEAIPEAAGVMGILTFEDVLEELLQEEIYDEMDRLEQSHLETVKWVIQKWKLYVKKRKLQREIDELTTSHEEVLSFQGIVSEVAHRHSLMAAEKGMVIPDVKTPLLGNRSGIETTERPSFFGLFGGKKGK